MGIFIKFRSFCKAGPLNQSFCKQESNLLCKKQSLNMEEDKTVGKSLNDNSRISLHYPQCKCDGTKSLEGMATVCAKPD